MKSVTLAAFFVLPLHADVIDLSFKSEQLALDDTAKEEAPFIDFAKYDKMGIQLMRIAKPAGIPAWKHIEHIYNERLESWQASEQAWRARQHR